MNVDTESRSESEKQQMTMLDADAVPQCPRQRRRLGRRRGDQPTAAETKARKEDSACGTAATKQHHEDEEPTAEGDKVQCTIVMTKTFDGASSSLRASAKSTEKYVATILGDDDIMDTDDSPTNDDDHQPQEQGNVYVPGLGRFNIGRRE